MAKEIVEYTSNIAPVASAGGVMTPYREAPPMANINQANEMWGAVSKFGKAVENVGEDLQKIKAYEDNHNEEIIAHKAVNDYHLKMTETLELHKQNNRGVNAMLPEFVDETKQILDDQIASSMETVSKLSPKNMEAARKAFDQIKLNGLHNAIQYQTNQRHEVEKEIILTDFLKSESLIKQGVDPTTVIANHMKMVEQTSPGDTTQAQLNAQKLSMYAVEATKDKKETEIILNLNDKHNGNIDEMLKEVESAGFLKQHSKQTQHAIRADIIARGAIQEQQYNKFAVQVVGNASIKILNNQKLTIDDTNGLRPQELATLEKIKDYQTRQNKVEASNRKTEARLAAAEKSSTISADIQMKILNNDYMDRLDIYNEVPKGLNIEEANRLVAMHEKILNDPKYKPGLDLIKKAFKNNIVKPVDQKALMDNYYKQVNAAGQAANPADIAQKLIKPETQSWISKALDYVSDPAKNFPILSDQKTKVKTVTIDGRVYKDGDLITNKDGSKGIVRVK